jgi:hypothetical protein
VLSVEGSCTVAGINLPGQPERLGNELYQSARSFKLQIFVSGAGAGAQDGIQKRLLE